MYYGEAGDVLRCFHTRDAFGMALVRRAGIALAWVSGEFSSITLARARKLQVEHVYVGVPDKRAVVEGLMSQLGASWEEVCYVGDDLNDLPVLKRAGLPVTVGQAVAPVRASCLYVCQQPGGGGAVREVCDLLLAAKGIDPVALLKSEPANPG